MALDPGTALNLVGSKITVAERWLKLYRKIHFLFLQFDFTNRNDFEFSIQTLNTRITTLETNIQATLAQINAKLSTIETHGKTHTHIAPPLGGPTAPPVPPLITGGPATFANSPLALTTKSFVTTRNNILQATGEPVVPVDTSSLI
jgi:hypothetical protein